MDNQDPYGFRRRFRSASLEELIGAFNRDVGNSGWVAARGSFHMALREAFLATGLDCSSFISDGGMSLRYRIRLEGSALVTLPDATTARPKPDSVRLSGGVEAEPQDIYYGLGRLGLLFVEPSVALEQIAFNTARTWGEFQRGAPSLYQRALGLCAVDDGGVDQSEHSPFDRAQIPAFHDGDFPDSPEQLMLDLLPKEVQDRFGKVSQTVHNGPYLSLDPRDEHAVVAALREAGFNCLLRQDLIDKMCE